MAPTSTTGNAFDVLLVEDNPGDAKLVKHYLERGRVQTFADEIHLEHVADLTTALDYLTNDECELVLLDLGLPESRGLDTLERVTSEIDDVPVVVLTGLDDTETALTAIQQGAQDYLPKDDLDSDSLMRALRYAIEREKQAKELRRRTEQLEFFNSILRHDVQNGMDVIRRNAQLLERNLSADRRDRAETIVDWSNDIIKLSQSVRRMLDVVAHEGEVTLRPVEVTTILKEQVDVIEGMRENVTVTVSANDTVAVMADEMLDEVLNNVLTNAVEHGGPDETSIDVTVLENDGTARIQIADNGPGISESARDRILGRGEKGGASSGSGFGLYFVTTMVESYGGSIHIDDNEPRGTVFSIELSAA